MPASIPPGHVTGSSPGAGLYRVYLILTRARCGALSLGPSFRLLIAGSRGPAHRRPWSLDARAAVVLLANEPPRHPALSPWKPGAEQPGRRPQTGPVLLESIHQSPLPGSALTSILDGPLVSLSRTQWPLAACCRGC